MPTNEIPDGEKTILFDRQRYEQLTGEKLPNPTDKINSKASDNPVVPSSDASAPEIIHRYDLNQPNRGLHLPDSDAQ
jgi:hypothetical protein